MSDLFKIYRAQFKRVLNDITVVTALLVQHILYLLKRAVGETDGIKAQLRCTVKFFKAADPNTTKEGHFNSKQTIYLHTSNFRQQYDEAMAQIRKQIDVFTHNGSGWVVEKVLNMDLYISKYQPIRGNTYCKLPKALKNTKAIVNIKNHDEKCFMWSILAALHPQSVHPERTSHYRDLEGTLDFSGIPFPVSLDDIPKFEEQNQLAINVLGYGSGLFPLYSSSKRNVPVINLLLLTPDGEPAHYCLIKNLNRLLFRQTKYEHKKYICNHCLCPYNTQARLDKHLQFCQSETQRVEMPEEDVLQFKNIHKQLRAPYVMYADFECFTRQTGDEKKPQEHIPNSYGLLGVRQCCNGTLRYDNYVEYRGANPVSHFLDCAIAKGDDYQTEVDLPLNLTNEEEARFMRCNTCHICKQSIIDEKVRDHCHKCGKFRGTAHPECNLKLRQNRSLTVFFHNLRRYDGHLIMQEIGLLAKKRNISIDCVPKGMEDYITFNLNMQTSGRRWKLRFVDSCAFLNASLETLASTLTPEEFHAVCSNFENPQQRKLLLRKGVYPYDYVDDETKFADTLPPPEGVFYNKLKLEHISDEDYKHVHNVWRSFGCNNLGDYHDLYLKADVLILADVFEAFRSFALENYGLDPVHYITLPSFSWDALLKYSGVKLELLRNADMYHFFSAGIRGGVSTITHRYAKANNPLLPDHDATKHSSYIVYLDINNLYGWAMKQKLPVGDFEYVGEMDALPNDEYGYVLEVDLDYPVKLHWKHNDYPLAPEKFEIKHISPYCRKLKEVLELKDPKVDKLVPNLQNKRNYIIHHRNLRQYLALGMEIKKIHGGIRFKEEAWMAGYIDFNTEKRKQATSNFHKDLFKLLNNAVFGKSMENVFNYSDIRLVTEPLKYQKLVASPLYKESEVFNHDLTAVSMIRETVCLNKPIYTGFSVLELSKFLMYDFHYGYMLPKYDDSLRLLFTDTDSLCYHVQTDDIYADLLKDRDEWFDTSDYPTDHFLHSTKNKKVIGLMKDETCGRPIAEFVGLRSKMYSIKCGDNEMKRAKGISRAVVKKEISHEDYRETLFRGTLMEHQMTLFRSIRHDIFTVNMNKISLSAYDDKRFVCDDGIHTLAYGSCLIK
jgi:hypothetical protein